MIQYVQQEENTKLTWNPLFFHLFTGYIHGTAKQANIVAVKAWDWYGHSKIDWIIEAFEWISDHIKQTSQLNTKSVINMSWGFDDYDEEYSYFDDIIRQIPAVPVAAAGNDNTDACFSMPSRFTSVITVGATNAFDRLSWYTNYGSCVDILAPGDDILSASHRDSTSEVEKSGTSMSAPFVSGNYMLQMSALLFRSYMFIFQCHLVTVWFMILSGNSMPDIMVYVTSSKVQQLGPQLVFTIMFVLVSKIM